MNYWVVIDRKKIGPLTLEETLRMPLTADSYVWHRGLPTWVHASEVPELAKKFGPPVEAKTVTEATESAETEMDTKPETASEAEATVASVEEHEESAAMPKSEAERPLPPTAPVMPPPPPPYRPAQQNQWPPANVRPERPDSYLGWCVASIILCCMITGIVAVVYATKVNPLYDRGEYEAARKASEKTELWLIISIVLGLVSLPFQIVMMCM